MLARRSTEAHNSHFHDASVQLESSAHFSRETGQKIVKLPFRVIHSRRDRWLRPREAPAVTKSPTRPREIQFVITLRAIRDPRREDEQ